MDYEQIYKDLLQKARKLRDENCDGCKMCLESLFPELKESEDERIRRAILSYIDYEAQRGGEWFGVKVDDIIAWLEKQGERKQWKPTEEQIHWLKWTINRLPDTEKANEAEEVLEDLLEGLKQRMGGQQ